MKQFLVKLFANKEGALDKDVVDIVRNLRLIAECEAHVSEFYRHVAEVRQSEKEFWLGLSNSEAGHAEAVLKMIAIMESHPERFKKGVKFAPSAIRTFSIYMDGVISRLHRGQLSASQLLDTAAQIEGSACEVDFVKMVASEDEEFNSLAAGIRSETESHKELILNKLREL